MKASGYGSGWHGESLRHSRARRLGVAGGKYAKFETCVKKVKLQEGVNPYAVCRASTGYYGKTNPKTMTYKELQKTGHHLTPNADTDKDGVPNKDDCRPLDPKRQDITMETTEPAKEGFWDKIKEYKAKRAERAEKAKAEEHEARMKEIKRLKDELAELKEKKEAQQLMEQEQAELQKIKEERDALKHEKARRRIEATKTFLTKTGKLALKAGKYLKKELKTTRKRGRKGRKSKPLLDLSV